MPGWPTANCSRRKPVALRAWRARSCGWRRKGRHPAGSALPALLLATILLLLASVWTLAADGELRGRLATVLLATVLLATVLPATVLLAIRMMVSSFDARSRALRRCIVWVRKHATRQAWARW